MEVGNGGGGGSLEEIEDQFKTEIKSGLKFSAYKSASHGLVKYSPPDSTVTESEPTIPACS